MHGVPFVKVTETLTLTLGLCLITELGLQRYTAHSEGAPEQDTGSGPGLHPGDPATNVEGPGCQKFNSALQNYMGETSGQCLKQHNLEEIN